MTLKISGEEFSFICLNLKGLIHNLLHQHSHQHPCHNLVQTTRQTVKTKSVRFTNTKETSVRVTDGKLSICHCAEPFGQNQREMRAFKGQAKLRLKPQMLWCAPQIRAKRLYCFSSASPFVLLCLKGVGGRERKNTVRNEEERDAETKRRERETES